MTVGSKPEVLDGRYELGPVIGNGGMGVVRRGVDQRLGRAVAVKLLRPDLAADDDARRRFADEAAAAARVHHPAVVTVFDSGVEADCAYIVMECLPGRTLADELRAGPLANDRLRRVAVDLLDGIAAAHACGVLHRDIKPANVLLDDQGAPKLADFGIAKTPDAVDVTMTGMVFGTTAYLSPERLIGQPAAPADDLYALGVVLYEAATGHRPYEGATPAVIAHLIHTSAPVPVRSHRADCDPQLAAVIDRALAKEASRRFRTAAEMRAALDASEAPTMAHVAAPTAQLPVAQLPVAPPVLHAPRRITPLAAVLAVAAVTLASVGLLMVRAEQNPQPRAVPTTSVPHTSPLPPALDDALHQLEQSVAK